MAGFNDINRNVNASSRSPLPRAGKNDDLLKPMFPLFKEVKKSLPVRLYGA